MPGKYVCVVSDATGGTAERVVRATLAQFPGSSVTVDLMPAVCTAAHVGDAVQRAHEGAGLVAYTLVDPSLRREMALLANEAGVVTIDLLGPLMTALGELLTAIPAYRPGLYTDPDAEHRSRLDAVAYTVDHDDGQRVDELEEADVVILGPSRCSKTPLSVYLSHTRALKVANVPLVLGIEPFDAVERLRRPCVVGLTMNAEGLSRLRKVRQEQLGAGEILYAGIEHVRRELHFCHEIYRRHAAWFVVDVTGKAIEEIAANICTQRGMGATSDAGRSP